MTGPPVSNSTVQVTGATSGIVRNRQPRVGQRPPGVRLDTPLVHPGPWTFTLTAGLANGSGVGTMAAISVGFYTRAQWNTVTVPDATPHDTFATGPSDSSHFFLSSDYYDPFWTPPEPDGSSGRLVADDRWWWGNAPAFNGSAFFEGQEAKAGFGGGDFQNIVGSFPNAFPTGGWGCFGVPVNWDYPIIGVMVGTSSGIDVPGTVPSLRPSLPPLFSAFRLTLTNGVSHLGPFELLLDTLTTTYDSPGKNFIGLLQANFVSLTVTGGIGFFDLSQPPPRPRSIATGQAQAGLLRY